MRYGSLFSGAGGLDLAIEEVFGAECAWQCELELLEDKNGKVRPNAAVKVLEHHWPGVPNLGDISAVDWSTVEPIDILCGGFPCQDVSTAGMRAGLAAGTRSGLWAMFAKAIAALRPRIVVIENVEGLLSAKAHRGVEPDDAAMGDGPNGPVLLRAAGAVLGDLAELGYDAQWTTVAASAVGAPHQRKRVFILATDTSDSAGHRQRACAELGQGSRLATDPTGGGWSRVDGGAGRTSARGGWERLTGGGTGSSSNAVTLLPTPTARLGDPNGRGASHPDRRKQLCSKRSGELDEVAVHLLPTPGASDSTGGGANPHDRRAAGHHLKLVDIGTDADAWGKYGAAIRRWQSATRAAPSPTEANTNGKPRLAAQFAEWMMGWLQGWVTAVPGISRNDQLRLIGNGVCPQQAEYALRQLIPLIEVAA